MPKRGRKRWRRGGAAADDDGLSPAERAELERAVAEDRIPAPWVAVEPRLVGDSHPAWPGRTLTALVATDPRRRGEPLTLAESMDFASWEHAAIDPVQARLCQDPECGVEGCEPGNWISLRRFDGGVELGVSSDRDPTDLWAWREHRPPRWLSEFGPCRIGDDDWARLVDAARASGLKLPAAGELPWVAGSVEG